MLVADILRQDEVRAVKKQGINVDDVAAAIEATQQGGESNNSSMTVVVKKMLALMR